MTQQIITKPVQQEQIMVDPVPKVVRDKPSIIDNPFFLASIFIVVIFAFVVYELTQGKEAQKHSKGKK